MRRIFALFILIATAALVGVVPAEANKDWDELVRTYGKKEEERGVIQALREGLLAEAPRADPSFLWEGLFLPGTEARRRASLGLALVEALCPEGDPARWEEVEGFWNPQEIPLSLASLDAVYGAVLALGEMDEKGASLLASTLLRRLLQSPRARVHAFLTAPVQYGRIVHSLPPWGPPWPQGELRGSLPLARSVRGTISESRALSLGHTFLDGYGRIASGTGFYAWDRVRGDIFRVRDGRDRLRWWFGD